MRLQKIGVANPMFAAFGYEEEEQREMAKAAHGCSGERVPTAMPVRPAPFSSLLTVN